MEMEMCGSFWIPGGNHDGYNAEMTKDKHVTSNVLNELSC